MCGRFVVTDTASRLAAEMLPGASPLAPNYNVAPMTNVSAVREWQGERVMPEAKWGYVPTWAKDFKKQRPQPINARLETVATSPMFRKAFQIARCVIPASGYYEWTVTESGKQPHYIHDPEGPLAMAGVIGAWSDPDKAEDDPEKWRLSMAIIMRDSHVAPGQVHDRMPACLPPDAIDDWLGDHLSAEALLTMLDQQSHAIAQDLVHYEVCKDANSVRNNGARLIEPLR